MELTIRLYADLVKTISSEVRQRFSGPIRSGRSLHLSIRDDCTVDDLIKFLKLPDDNVKVIFVNGRARERDWILESGDEVGIFPLVGGG